MKPPLIIAHRGHSSRYVENTLSAYRGAVNAGADVVECDARLSNDRNVWACHDADLARLTGTPSPVAGMSSGELAAIRLAGGERLMKLPSVLTEIAPDRTVLIDLKTDELALIEAVIRDVAAAKAVDLVWIGMRSIAQTSRVHSLEPKLKLLAFLPDYNLADEFERAGATAFRVWEGDLGLPAAKRLFGTRETWVTAGGRGTPHKVGDTSDDGLARILEHEPDGILLNDPIMPASLLGHERVPGTNVARVGR